MRLTTVASLITGLAATASAHTVNCWGKALHPPREDVQKALHWFDTIILNPTNPNFPPTVVADAHRCSEQFCHYKVSVRFCNDDNVIKYMPLQAVRDSVQVLFSECQANYKGKRVAGGVVDHPDHWNVIVQEDDKCAEHDDQESLEDWATSIANGNGPSRPARV